MSNVININLEKIEELLQRSVKEILPSKEDLKNKLISGEKMRIYIGTDATGTSLHLGHATNYMVLERFRQLGHQVIFLIGDFTSRIGDPTDKGDVARKQLSREDVVNNVKTWLEQIKTVIDIDNKDNPVQIQYNHDWLASLTFEDVINLASNFTVQQMIERDMFQKRITDNKPLYLHELFYPLMQGYDSVALNVDIEICGNDQKFNALAGRTLLKKMKNKDKFVFITTLLENPKTGEKMMSKSLGTGVFLDFSAERMYGAIMSQSDENMRQLFIDCTWLSLSEIDAILQIDNPRDVKMKLALEITKIYHGENLAQKAQDNFIETFQNSGVPDDLLEIKPNYIDNMIHTGLISSKTELRRLLETGSIKNIETDEKLESIPEVISEPIIIKIGKRRFVKLIN